MNTVKIRDRIRARPRRARNPVDAIYRRLRELKRTS